MKTIALEGLIADTILYFCENLAELGMPKDAKECDMWYRYLTPEEQYKVGEKLLGIIERERCDICGKPFPPQDKNVPKKVKEILNEVKTCTPCLEKQLIEPNDKDV